ncbi:MAG: hypothetical protein ACE5L7_01825 [Candidatus Aminicenantales bacterium]
MGVRIFGLIYSHPQPKDGRTFLIKNRERQPLPTTFSGDLATRFLLSKPEQNMRQMKMKRVCRSCHSSTWTDKYFAKFHSTVKEADQMVRASTELLLQAWDRGLADRANPFDEAIEQKWIKQWLYYANSIRYASAMSGPDYAAFKNGWFEISKNLQEMKDIVKGKSE